MFRRSPQLAQSICSDESLIEKAIRNKAKQGGCCMPVDGDTTGDLCQPMSRGQFTTCCQQACGKANSQYGCSLGCRGECDHLSNPFSAPATGGGVGGGNAFNSCLKQYCGTTDCDVRKYAQVEPQIQTCCGTSCKGDQGCLYDCNRQAINYKLGGLTGGGGTGAPPGTPTGGPGAPAGGNGDQAKRDFITQTLKAQMKGIVPDDKIDAMANCMVPALVKKMGLSHLYDVFKTPNYQGTDEENTLMKNVQIQCMKSLGATPPGTSPKKSQGKDSWFEKNKTAVYIILGLAALIVLVLVLSFFFFKKSGKKGSKNKYY